MSGRRARSRSRSVEIVPPGGQTRIRWLETMVQLLSQGLSMEREGVHILNGRVRELVGENRDLNSQVRDLNGRVRDLVGENRDLNSQVRDLNAQVQDLNTEVDSMRNSVLRLRSTQELLVRTVGRSPRFMNVPQSPAEKDHHLFEVFSYPK